MKAIGFTVAALVMLVTVQPVVAGDAAAGESIYAAKGCIACHGPGGNSANPAMFPKTAGLEEAYLAEQMTAFRDGARSNPMMSPMAVGLSDEDIANLAAYLSEQK